MNRSMTILVSSLLVAALCAGGCASMETTRFVNPNFNFSFVEKVAVLPLDNYSASTRAGERASRLIMTELLASGAVDVVEPGEVQAALSKHAGGSLTPTTEQIKALGEALGVQAVMIGSVTQAELVRSGRVQVPVVTLDLHLVETETGAAVWAATHTEKGSSFGTRVLGTGAEAISETMRACVGTLVDQLVG
jgi:curli biogenesis system outer membrane secretion channel CsgG